MSDAEDGALPVTREHVDKFLKWYGSLVKLPRYAGIEEHWFNAVQTLTLAEMRNGIRFVQSQTHRRYIEPVAFWHIAKNRRPPSINERFRQMREGLKIESQETKR